MNPKGKKTGSKSVTFSIQPQRKLTICLSVYFYLHFFIWGGNGEVAGIYLSMFIPKSDQRNLWTSSLYGFHMTEHVIQGSFVIFWLALCDSGTQLRVWCTLGNCPHTESAPSPSPGWLFFLLLGLSRGYMWKCGVT